MILPIELQLHFANEINAALSTEQCLRIVHNIEAAVLRRQRELDSKIRSERAKEAARRKKAQRALA